ncbi:MAG: hypothetical protein F4Y45_08540 [Acidobacteria bacterium]|nr:hypothetical protein [Acidobacteriota bacterium]MYJ03670.1 hypothetical protein [Acidobacteriota bacterium]
MNRWILPRLAAFLVVVVAGHALAQPANTGHGEESFNSRLVGMSDLQGRSAYQPLPVRQGERRIAYIGHHAGEALNPLTGAVEANGTSVVDVTDPAAPVYLAHIPATGGTSGAQMVQVCEGDRLPGADTGRFYLLRSNGNISHEVWDVTDPASPAFVSTAADMGRTPSGEQHTHKNWWECDTGVAYLVGTVDGWRAPRILQVFDLADPAAPRRIRDFSLPGVQPDASGPIPGGSGLHEAVILGNRVYMAYGTSADGAVQILDRERLLNGDPAAAAPLGTSPGALAYPQIGRVDLPSYWGAHTAMPLLDVEIADYAGNRDNATRDFLFVVSESTANRCQETRHVTLMLDITDEAHPLPIGTFQVDESSGDFCERGGRFGPHAPQWSMEPPFYGKLMVVSWFNAGARVIDIRDPFNMAEVAYYIPATTERTAERCATIDGVETCQIAIQTNNVEVDDRGLIYLADRADTGLHIVELTDSAATILEP